MADKGTRQGQMHLMDEHGNRVHQIDEPNATQGVAMGFAPPGTATHAISKDHHDEGQQLHHSGSSSSSSSEDDGEGGRRKKKKGIKEKIKGTLTGGGGADQGVPTTPAPTPTPTPTSTSEAQGGEKKGMMEKIKEKIPGMH